ncbi:hypothetical protein [Phenylobacterium sp.]|uniref:hypothetical protein n=1 Tax=Phenylobacterium sp. TaxID=1871053 RepID=UPI0035AE38B8
MSLSIDTQIEAMARLWPAFKLVRREGAAALWQGAVRPLLQTYRVGVFYRAPLMVERYSVRIVQPRVEILAPALRPRRGDAEGMLPHVYYGPDGEVTLCMLDPDSSEWSPADLLAETTVPWITDWLAAYEGWRATGEWTGTGRHVERA